MGEKLVTDLAGIGDVLGGKLSSKGFDKAYVVLGQFLLLKKNEELFKVKFICYSIVNKTLILGLAQRYLWSQCKTKW